MASTSDRLDRGVSRRSSRRPSPSPRPTSRRCWPTRRSASSGTCSWRPAVGAYTGAPSSTSSPTRSSRRCSSWRRGRSSWRCTTSRTYGRWAGLRRRIWQTHAVFWVGVVAISGFPPLSGFFSKDEILVAAYASHVPGTSALRHRPADRGVSPPSTCGACTSSSRLRRREPRGGPPARERIHESPPVVVNPLWGAGRAGCARRSCWACPRPTPSAWRIPTA